MSIRERLEGRGLLVLVGLFALIWIAYAVGMATRADNAFSPFHNDTFWPAQQYMTVAQPGLAVQIFGHVMITFVGGAFLSMLVVGLLALLRKAGGPDLAGVQWCRTAVRVALSVSLAKAAPLRACSATRSSPIAVRSSASASRP